MDDNEHDEPGATAPQDGREVRPGSLAPTGAGLDAIVSGIDRLYNAQIAAKDQQLAAKDDQLATKDMLIAELRQRLEQAERALIVARHDEADIGLAETEWAGRALSDTAVSALIAKLDQLYGEQIAAKDDQIAAKDELIAELRRRAEQAEQVGTVWEHEPSARQAAPRAQPPVRRRAADVEWGGEPAAMSTQADATATARSTQTETKATAREAVVHSGLSPARPGRARKLLVTALAIVLVAVVLSRVFAGAAPTSAHIGAPRPAFAHFSPIVGVPLPVLQVLAPAVGMASPGAALQLPNGQIAVVDTGNHRLILLDPAGHLVASVRAGGLQQPDALAAASGALYVLDAGRGTIERYVTSGRFVRDVIHSSALLGGRGMAIGPTGMLYVASPRSNSIVVLSDRGTIQRRITGPRGAGKGQLDAPSDVAVGADGRLYVADSANNRIQALTPSGAYVAQWPAPPSDPQHPLHLLPLRDGRLLVSDPAGGLLVYLPDGGLPAFRRALQLPSGQYLPAGPVGLSSLANGNVLATDSRGNRLLVVSMPH